MFSRRAFLALLPATFVARFLPAPTRFAIPDGQINVSAIPPPPGGVVARRLYRMKADGSYMLIGTVPDNALTFTDAT